jgi:hypothetical protein
MIHGVVDSREDAGENKGVLSVAVYAGGLMGIVLLVVMCDVVFCEA